MNPTIVFSIIAACISIGGVLITVGVIKGKINQNTEVNKAQDGQIEKCASKEELAAAIKRSDELLALMKERAEEDRSKGQGQYREFYGLLTNHAERIGSLETQHTGLAKALDELKDDIKSGFRKIEEDLKDLQKELKEPTRKRKNG